MDIVYASLRRRLPGPQPPGEKAEVLAALWAHAQPQDGLQHVTALCEGDRVDLLIYLRTADDDESHRPALARAEALITRTRQASPLLSRRYLAPPPTGC